ncbi:MAG: glutamate racemase [Lactobacillus sp.]|jgi:glutamate racemase|nr:glutamate racemase [Lactobacillus sp.]MCH3905981.1 glutamate racemase [Lactobacillus sp.]MCH3990445.1 glutamate racemase [Lactobacillus sp.]MCH4068840.1 glutamate racemase [Lactobacillus sp.]MCI1304465.1 glutamate racemase [Lactobacillus sp.]
MDNRPIGLMDSGLGGLSVVKKVIAKMPHEDTVFWGDQAHMPYGDRKQDDIINLARTGLNFLLSKDVKVVIFACNTMTAQAMPTLQAETDRQIIGVIQSGALLAAKKTHNLKVGVIATTATVESRDYTKEIQYRNPKIEVVEQATPKLAPLVEANEPSAVRQAIVAESLAPLQDYDFDSLVLGCTHYPFIASEIQAAVGPQVQLIDPADQVAQYTFNVLKRDGLLADRTVVGMHRYFTTGKAATFSHMARAWLNAPGLTAEHLD